MSSVIDGVFIVLMMIIIGYLFQNDSQMVMKVRVATMIFLFFIYEPLCTSKLYTIGQKLTGIRVRSMGTTQKITLPRAYLRIVFKLSLGLISFFTLPFTRYRRAIHDLVAGSLVINCQKGR